jgi:DNA-directed DNA polymerase III PolC
MKAVSPHCHPESYLTSSTITNLVNRCKDLNRVYFTHTDNGSLSSAMKSYGLAKKAGLKPILGLEFYFKDTNCPFVTGTKADRCKYYTATIYAQNQEAFQAIVKQISRTDLPTTEIYEEKQILWDWSVLEHLSKFKTSLVLSGVHCIVGKNHLAGESEVSQKVFNKLHQLFGQNLSVALLAEPWNKKYATVVKIEHPDGTHSSVLNSDTVTTDKARNIKAQDLIDRPGHTLLKSFRSNLTNNEVNKSINNVTLYKGFLPLPCDASLEVNKHLYSLAKACNTPVLVTDYAYYAESSDRIVQDLILEGKTKLKSSLHIKTESEVRDYLKNIMQLSEEESNKIITNNETWAKKFDDFELKYNWRLPDSGGEPLKQAMAIIRANGRMKWDNLTYIDRLKEELEVIAKNGVKDLTGYFLPICDVMNHYKENGKLVGPARGSAAGSLLAYLLGITQVDSIKADLSFPRFLSLDRIKNGDYPDVDSDFGTRVPLVGEDNKSGYLYGKWGSKAAQISTRHTLRLKSSIKDVNRYFNGKVEPEIEIFTKSLPDPPQGVSDSEFIFGYEDKETGIHNPGLIEIDESLQKYVEKRPQEWEIVKKSLGITRAFSSHASAFVIADVPICDIVPTKEGNITQYEAKAVEQAKLLKYDFLVVSQIQDIETCLNLINKKNNETHTIGYFTHKNEKCYIWDLPEDSDAFKSVWDGSTETLFQINTKAMIPFVKEILPQSVEDISTIVALVRPGPLDYVDQNTGRNMAEEYVWRRQGKSEPDFKELYDLIPETKGVIIYQEQATKIAKELGGMSPSDAEKLRRVFAKKQKKEAGEMRPVFMSTAIAKIGEEKANKIWDMLETSSRYSFNKSHSYSYSLITYASIFLRHNYPLEWYAAILTHAEEKEITGKLWPYVKKFVLPPDINLSTDSMVVDYNQNKIRSKLGVIRGIGDATIEPIVAQRPYLDVQDFVNKDVAGPSLSHKLIHVGVLDSLFPTYTNLLEKLKLYEDAVEKRNFANKLQKSELTGQKVRAAHPKEGRIPQEYVNLSPLKNAMMIKNTLPSMPLDLYDLGKRYSSVRANPEDPCCDYVINSKGYKTLLIDGARLKRLEEMSGEGLQKDAYVAATVYVIEAKEFAYPKRNPTKRALKLIIDACGHTLKELVMWPHYESGELLYSKDLKRGVLATVFFRKRMNKKELTVTDIVVESC